MEEQQTGYSPTIEAPETVSSFIKFMNRGGQAVSREWVYGQFKKKALPSLKIGRKILVMRSEVLAKMRTLGEE